MSCKKEAVKKMHSKNLQLGVIWPVVIGTSQKWNNIAVALLLPVTDGDIVSRNRELAWLVVSHCGSAQHA